MKNIRQRAGLWLFDGLLIVLIFLALLLLSEICLRGFLAVRGKPFVDTAAVDLHRQRLDWKKLNLGSPSKTRPVTEAYKEFPWAADYLAEAERHPDPGLVYEPFSLWKHVPYRTRYICYGENGYRRTINPAKASFDKRCTVFVFGGSTIAGDGVLRDEDLIPSQLSEILNRLYPNTLFEVRSYAQSGFNQGNEVVLLARLLAGGERPNLVLFYDGDNDVVHRIGFGEPHMSYSFFKKSSSFFNYTIKDTIRMWLLSGLRNKSALLRSLLPPMEDPRAEEVYLAQDPQLIKKRSDGVAEFYAGNMDLVRALSEHYHFRHLLFLQPNVFTKRVRSVEEQQILERVRAEASSLEEIFTVGYPAIRERFRDSGAGDFVDVTDLYQESPVSVYVDPAHVSPRGNLLIAQRIAEECLRRKLLPE